MVTWQHPRSAGPAPRWITTSSVCSGRTQKRPESSGGDNPTFAVSRFPSRTTESLSALVWGSSDPEIVLLHGGAQNAHTWDTVALALDRPLVAIDLPGHGHSDWRADHAYWPAENAADLAVAIRSLAPNAALVVGMSLGGLSALALSRVGPELVRKLLLVDVTPGVNEAKAAPIINFIAGPESFTSFEELLERTIMFNPTRLVSSLRRGVLHNARPMPDGQWTWRYDRFHPLQGDGPPPTEAGEFRAPDFQSLWEDLSGLRVPFMLVRGGESGVVGDDDIAEVRRRVPSARIEVVDGAGHSIQGDRPVALAAILEEFLASDAS